MKITFYEKVQIAAHIERKIESICISNEEIKEKVYEDLERQLKREFGLNRKHPNLKKKHLADAHELIDTYELPTYLQEQVNDCNAQISMEIA